MRSFQALERFAPSPCYQLGLAGSGVLAITSSTSTSTSPLACLYGSAIPATASRLSRPGFSARQRRWYAASWDIKQEDKKETREHLERLEIKERDRTEKAKNGSGGMGRSNQKIEDAMRTGRLIAVAVQGMMLMIGVGKLLTTPSRLFKLLIPLPTAHHNKKHMGVFLYFPIWYE